MKFANLISAIALVAATSTAALAQPAAGTPPAGGGMAACREDMVKLCPDKTGPDRRTCMEANKDKLSEACKAARAARASGGQ